MKEIVLVMVLVALVLGADKELEICYRCNGGEYGDSCYDQVKCQLYQIDQCITPFINPCSGNPLTPIQSIKYNEDDDSISESLYLDKECTNFEERNYIGFCGQQCSDTFGDLFPEDLLDITCPYKDWVDIVTVLPIAATAFFCCSICVCCCILRKVDKVGDGTCICWGCLSCVGLCAAAIAYLACSIAGILPCWFSLTVYWSAIAICVGSLILVPIGCSISFICYSRSGRAKYKCYSCKDSGKCRTCHNGVVSYSFTNNGSYKCPDCYNEAGKCTHSNGERDYKQDMKWALLGPLVLVVAISIPFVLWSSLFYPNEC